MPLPHLRVVAACVTVAIGGYLAWRQHRKGKARSPQHTCADPEPPAADAPELQILPEVPRARSFEAAEALLALDPCPSTTKTTACCLHPTLGHLRPSHQRAFHPCPDAPRPLHF
ncbi:hypothetical protein WJX73_006381 [Symbiochloris irregularis]|uniref:Uncharacterized protein n=1 Tax=Symbiochloris irregularis TaxID=706552 RepID=A0AAW1P5W2_9CHLO